MLMEYLGTIDYRHDEGKGKKSPICIHLSAQGNEKGLAFGPDFSNLGRAFYVHEANV